MTRQVTTAIAVEHLVKRYGVHAAVNDVSFEVRRGEVVGFLGPNGAGKSTTLRILVGFLGATSGTARIEGHDVQADPHAARAALGYMPEAVPLYGEMRVGEYLRFRAELKGVGRAARTAAVGRALELARVVDVKDTLIDHLSKGYRQRVGLADALVSNPRVLVLDEPTAGMDPNQIRDVRALIKSLGGEQTVLLSTHILPEVEASCGRVVVIDKGRLVAEGTPSELSELRRPPRLELVLRGAPARKVLAASPFEVLEEHEEGDARRFVVATPKGEADRTAEEAAVERLVGALVEAGVGVRSVERGKASLEDVFASLTHAAPEADAPSDGKDDAGDDGDTEEGAA